MTDDLWPTPNWADPPAEVIQPEEAAAPAPVVPRAQLAAEAVWWDAVAAQAKSRAAGARNALDKQAQAEFARDGIAPTWRIPDVGTVPLSLTADRVDVVDEAAYTEWVAATFPEQVETIVTTRVRPAYDEVVRKAAAKRRAACTEDGEVIPGLEFVAGGAPKGISIRASSDAKESAAALADAALDGLFEARTAALAVARLVVDEVQAEVSA
ncbi:hypothetical protein [Dactylosporangium salmoneum]|uniref:Uncharacterized protein n=1 Tax=Dactylosporangium salmoneum TaxID=53361 RepID=A0ABN3FDI7_9ACTN